MPYENKLRNQKKKKIQSTVLFKKTKHNIHHFKSYVFEKLLRNAQ